MCETLLRKIWLQGVPFVIAGAMVVVGAAGIVGWISYSPIVATGMAVATALLLVIGYQTYQSVSAKDPT